MSHQAVRTLISDTLKSIDDSILFAYARASDFNQIGIKDDKRVRLDPLRQSLEYNESFNLSKQYQVTMFFYKLDSLQAAEEETAKILDDTDLISDKFINKLNLFSFTEDSTDELSTQNTEISSIRKEPIIKVTADCVTGWGVSFNFTVPDTFNYCSLYE
jgi:hypothetical protein